MLIEKLFSNKPAGLNFSDIDSADKTKMMRGDMTKNLYDGKSINKETGEENEYKMKIQIFKIK